MPPRRKLAAVIASDEPAVVEPESIKSLVMKCLDAKATMADVGRLYKMKDELLVINWDDSSSLALKSMLISCVECRTFYKCAPGISFLAIVFNLHPLMLPLITEVLKRCVLTFPHALLLGCSQVLFKAWQLSTGGMRMLIEQSLTEWMRKALFATTKTAERVRFLLSEIHGTRRSAEIDSLLSRFYGPILFRHTKVANWEVRFNAVALLCAAFPVMPPDRSAIEFEEKLTVQFRILKDSMEDPNESVRKVSVVGTGRILRDFWEVLTIEQIAMVLDTLSEKCAKDRHSSKTRIAAVNAVSLIIDNPLSHGVLGQILPTFCPKLLNDTDLTVRLGLANLLSKLCATTSIRLADVVPQTTVFGRLAADKGTLVAQVLGGIVAPSLFAGSVDEQAIKCERMAEMLPEGFLALTENCAPIAELDKVRLSVALLLKGFKLIKQEGPEAKIRVLFRAATNLLNSTSLAGVQGTEDVYKPDSDSQKLCGFIYKHVIDREVDQLLVHVFPANVGVGGAAQLGGDLLNALACLDGTRLPMVYCRIGGLLDSFSESCTRVASVWGMYGVPASRVHWDRLMEACKLGGTILADSTQVFNMLDVSLKLKNTETILKNREFISQFLTAISAKLPNVGFVMPNCLGVVKLCLATCLWDVGDEHRCAMLSAVVHRMNIGLFTSLTTAPIGPVPVPKRSKREAPGLTEIALSAFEMTEFIAFYLHFLVVANVLLAIPLKACKFEDLIKVYWCWAGRMDISPDTDQMISLVDKCVESEQGAQICFAVAEPLLSKLADPKKLLTTLVKEFAFTNEFSTLVTKVNLEGNRPIIEALAAINTN